MNFYKTWKGLDSSSMTLTVGKSVEVPQNISIDFDCHSGARRAAT